MGKFDSAVRLEQALRRVVSNKQILQKRQRTELSKAWRHKRSKLIYGNQKAESAIVGKPVNAIRENDALRERIRARRKMSKTASLFIGSFSDEMTKFAGGFWDLGKRVTSLAKPKKGLTMNIGTGEGRNRATGSKIPIGGSRPYRQSPGTVDNGLGFEIGTSGTGPRISAPKEDSLATTRAAVRYRNNQNAIAARAAKSKRTGRIVMPPQSMSTSPNKFRSGFSGTAPKRLSVKASAEKIKFRRWQKSKRQRVVAK